MTVMEDYLKSLEDADPEIKDMRKRFPLGKYMVEDVPMYIAGYYTASVPEGEEEPPDFHTVGIAFSPLDPRSHPPTGPLDPEGQMWVCPDCHPELIKPLEIWEKDVFN